MLETMPQNERDEQARMTKHTIGGIELTKAGAKVMLYQILTDVAASTLTENDYALLTFLEDDEQVKAWRAKHEKTTPL